MKFKAKDFLKLLNKKVKISYDQKFKEYYRGYVNGYDIATTEIGEQEYQVNTLAIEKILSKYNCGRHCVKNIDDALNRKDKKYTQKLSQAIAKALPKLIKVVSK